MKLAKSKNKKGNASMKLTKSKLKQIIKEELNDIAEQGEEPGGAEPEWPAHLGSGPWVTGVKQILAAASRLYENMPLEGKEAITDHFEWYTKRWREQMRAETGDRPSWMRKGADGDDEAERERARKAMARDPSWRRGGGE